MGVPPFNRRAVCEKLGAMLRWSIVLAVVVACGGGGKTPERPRPPRAGGEQAAPGITWRRVETARDVPGAPAPGTYQIHLIDVGTGLAILVRGADFALLYDAGSNDKDEKPLRV